MSYFCHTFVIPDNNDVTAYVTHRDIANTFMKEEVHSSVITFNDIVTLDIYRTINTAEKIGMYLAIQTTDDCSNYEFMWRMDCNGKCSYRECQFEYVEVTNTVLYCKSKCRATSKVLIRRAVKPWMTSLPSFIKIEGITAMTLIEI